MVKRPFSSRVAKRLAFEVLHHQEVDTVLTPNVVQRADVRMIQSSDGARFALKSLAHVRIGCDMRGQHFDRHRATKTGVVGSVDLSHAACTEWRDDFVRPETSAC